MDIICLNSDFEEKGVITAAEADMTVAPGTDDDTIFLKCDIDNSENISIGDYAAVEGTDIGGRITDIKIDYGSNTVEFSGCGWWRYFEKLYVSETAIVNKTLTEAVTLVLNNSQFGDFEVVGDSDATLYSFETPLGVKQSLADCLVFLEEISGKIIKFRYEENKLKIIIRTSAVFDGINVSRTEMAVEVKSFLPDYYVLIGDETKPQYDEQEPIATIDDEEIYPQTVLFYDIEAEECVLTPDTTKNIFLLDCNENTEAEMTAYAEEKYAEELSGAFGISGKLGEELNGAEVKDTINFSDENFNLSFTRKIEKKIYQKTANDETVEFELGDISYI